MQINLLNAKGKLFVTLHKAARRKLRALNAEHVVFGVDRDARGQLRTFFKPMTDAELDAYAAAQKDPFPILAVHA